jgi:hypothetical protein
MPVKKRTLSCLGERADSDVGSRRDMYLHSPKSFGIGDFRMPDGRLRSYCFLIQQLAAIKNKF